MSISVKARVHIALDGKVYAPGAWITLPDEQLVRAQALVTYGLADEAPAAPVRTRKKAS